MINALITGGAGFIGSHLAEELLKNNYSVVVIDNLSNGRIENMASFSKNKNFTFLNIDIRDKDVLDKLNKNFEYIFHLAGMADIVPSIENPKDYYDVNVSGTFNILEFAKNNKNLKKYLYAASSSCYGIPDSYPTNELTAIKPQYPYALTKFLGEELVLHWANCYRLPCISLRLFNVYGPRSRTTGTYGAVFGVFLAQKIKNKPFTVVGDGTQTRDFTYVSDVVQAFIQSSQSNIINEIFNIGSGSHYSVNHLVNLLGGDKVFIPKRPGEPDCTFADITKIKKYINWVPKIKFEDGIKLMLENIHLWNNAPVWNQNSINEATKTWFKYLGN